MRLCTQVLIGCVNCATDARITVRNYAVNPPLSSSFARLSHFLFHLFLFHFLLNSILFSRLSPLVQNPFSFHLCRTCFSFTMCNFFICPAFICFFKSAFCYRCFYTFKAFSKNPFPFVVILSFTLFLLHPFYRLCYIFSPAFFLLFLFFFVVVSLCASIVSSLLFKFLLNCLLFLFA